MTIPANPTDRIAPISAYDWREDLDSIEACEEVSECADGCCTFFTPRHNDECVRLAAYIVDVESERDSAYELYSVARAHIERLEAERDALLAEHEAWDAYRAHEGRQRKWDDAWAAHDNAERVIRGE